LSYGANCGANMPTFNQMAKYFNHFFELTAWPGPIGPALRSRGAKRQTKARRAAGPSRLASGEA